MYHYTHPRTGEARPSSDTITGQSGNDSPKDLQSPG